MKYIYFIAIRYVASNNSVYTRRYIASLNSVRTTDAIERALQKFELNHSRDTEIADIRVRRQDNEKEWIIDPDKFSIDWGY